MTAEPIAFPQAAPSMLCRNCLALVAAAGACPCCGSLRTVSHPELGDLAIAHIDCDAFYAAIEKRDDPDRQRAAEERARAARSPART